MKMPAAGRHTHKWQQHNKETHIYVAQRCSLGRFSKIQQWRFSAITPDRSHSHCKRTALGLTCTQAFTPAEKADYPSKQTLVGLIQPERLWFPHQQHHSRIQVHWAFLGCHLLNNRKENQKCAACGANREKNDRRKRLLTVAWLHWLLLSMQGAF